MFACCTCESHCLLPCAAAAPCTAPLLACAPQVHSKIRANPTLKKKDRKNPGDGKRWKTPKSTYEVKKANLKAKLAAMADDE